MQSHLPARPSCPPWLSMWLWAVLLSTLMMALGACGDGASPAPTISVQPGDTSAVAGSAATLSVTASGTDISYQWQSSSDGGASWRDIAAATQASHTTPATRMADNGTRFRVIVSAAGISVTSSAVTLSVTGSVVPSAITVQPAAQGATAPDAATFSVTVAGSASAHQWQRSTDGGTTWADIAGATAASYSTGSTDVSMNASQYRVVVSNSAGSVTSAAVVLTVVAAPAAAAITIQPLDQSVTAGRAAAFTAAATGTPTPSLQWQRSTDGGTTWRNIADATASTHNTGPTVLTQNGERYRVVASNGTRSASSNAALLSVTEAAQAPLITAQPTNTSVTAPAAATFTATASGVPTPTWQWQQSIDSGTTWANINGATAASHTTPATAVAASGRRYRVIASNSAAMVYSTIATLTVTAAQAITVSTLVSVSPAGAVADNTSSMPSLSANGTRVAFTSVGTNLVAGATNAPAESGHAYVRNLGTGVTELVNRTPGGSQSSRGVVSLKLAAEGRYVVFSSLAGDLVVGDTNGSMDVFLRDLQTGSTTRLNVLPDGSQLTGLGNAITDVNLAISADGRWVTFTSAHDLLGNGSPLPVNGLYLRDTQNNVTRLVESSAASGVFLPLISNDASRIVFGVQPNSLTQHELRSYDIASGGTVSLFTVSTATFPDGIGSGLSVSDNGRYVAFSLRSAALLGGSTSTQVVVLDQNNLGTLTIASTGVNGVGNGPSGYPVLSGDGRHVLFASNAVNVTGATDATVRTYLMVRDLVALTTKVASRRPNGTAVWTGSGEHGTHALSADAAVLAFVASRFDMTGESGDNQVYVAPRP